MAASNPDADDYQLLHKTNFIFLESSEFQLEEPQVCS